MATAQAQAAARPLVRKRRRSWRPWTFIGPFMLVFLLTLVAPLVYASVLSLFRDQMVGGVVFVGLDNYVTALNDPQFWSGLGRVSLFLIIQVPVMLCLALFVALAVDSARLYGSNFFRISIFMPYAVPGVVATLMWGFMYGTRFGLVGNINDIFGITLPAPLSSEYVLAAIGNIVVWQFLGYNMLIFYSALRVIPHTLYEAAEIDGASQWRVVSAIKLPAIRGVLVIATIFSIIGSFQLFNEPSILQSLVPQLIPSYFTPNLYAYNLSFAGQQVNYAATIAILMGLVTMIVAYAVQLRGMRREV